MKNALSSLLILVCLTVVVQPIKAQLADLPTDPAALEKEILQMDSLLFDVAFNECKLAVWEKIMGQDFEFYDDRSGLNTDRQVEINAFHDRCSKPFTLIRTLIETDVHPLGDYGAVQLGKHNFSIDGKVVELADFVIVWEKTDKDWVVKRVVSYNHQPVE